MIEDLDGATVEPTRRGHVVVLSAATAALALALLVALVVPPSGASVVEAPSAAPRPSDAPTMVVLWADMSFAPGSGRVTLDQLRSQQESPLVCAVPGPNLWVPAFVSNGVSYAVGERTGPAVVPPPAYVATSRSGWLTMQIYDRTGQLVLLYTCGESDVLAPRIDLAPISP